VRLRVPLAISTLIAGTTLAVLSAALSTSAAQAQAIPAPVYSFSSLPLTSYFQMAVDSTNDHLFFSQGSASENSILVTDFSGGTVATIAGQTGVKGITLSPDGSTLYAALAGADAVSAISTATLQQTAVYQLPAGDTPYFVAVQSGKLWVSYQTGTAGDAAIGDFDLSAADPSFATQAPMGGWGSAPEIAADPSGSGNVLVATDGLDPSTAASYDTAQDPVTVHAQKTLKTDTNASGNCASVNDLAVVPGGAQFIVTCDDADEVFSTTNLGDQGTYPTASVADGVAVASGTGMVAASVGNGPIFVFTSGDTLPVSEFGGITAGSELVPAGLGITADGAWVFAVMQDGSGYTLDRYDNEVLLTFNGPLTAGAGQPVTLSGTLTIGGVAAPAGDTISITRTGPGTALTESATTGADGAFSITDTPPGTGQYGYIANYDGSPPEVFSAVSYLTVSLRPATLTLTATPANAGYAATLHVTAHLGTTHSNRDVSIYAEPVGGKTRTLLGTRQVNSSGNVTIDYKATHSTTFTAAFTGDAWYLAKSVTSTDAVHASVAAKITGYYGSKKVGSTTRRLYHHTAHLKVAATVAPNKAGECVKVEVQEFRKGAWRASSLSGCHALSKSSAYAVSLALTHDARNYPYRVRVDYVRGKDTSNLSTDSSWLYFLVEG
jgi:YVTN family beta-propeller protein